MLVINSILGPRKTLTFIGLVVIMATITGILFGVMSTSPADPLPLPSSFPA
jgi:uncharacterized membrane protein YraQ (UPF0718 family)